MIYTENIIELNLGYYFPHVTQDIVKKICSKTEEEIIEIFRLLGNATLFSIEDLIEYLN